MLLLIVSSQVQPMLKNPQFKPHLQVNIRRGEGVFLLSEMHQTVLQGELYEAVAPFLDGRSVEEVCRQLSDRLQPSHVFYTLNKLEQKGVLCDRDQETPGQQAAFWTLQGIDPPLAVKRLAASTVSLEALGVEAGPLEALLESLHVRLAEEGEMHVVVTDHYLNPELATCNRDALASGRPWLLVKPVGGMIWIGPLFRPGTTACWECLAARIRSNSPVLGYLQNVEPDRPVSVCDLAHTPATMSVAWGLAANAIATLIATEGGSLALEGRIQTLNLVHWQAETHILVKQPACPVCGTYTTSDETPSHSPPVTLQSCKKTCTDDSGHRSQSPQETLDKYSHHVSAICGAVSQLQKSVPVNDGVMHVYVSGNNAARGPQSMMGLKTDLRHCSAGKGTSDVQAKASALCEGLERSSGIFRGDEARHLATYEEMADEAIHPNSCMLFSERQYRERDERNRSSSVYNYIPVPFDKQRRIEWSPVWSLTAGRTRYLPTAQCYFNYPTSYNDDFCVSCSNGNAAGNTLEEAILQGFLELAERDSVSIWWYNRLQVPGVDLDRFNDPYLNKVRAYLTSHHRELWILDLTSDLQIPAFVAVSRRTVGPTEQIMFGFGAHLDPRIAVMRAVTELNQMLVPLLQYSDESLPGVLSDPDTLSWLQQATIAEHSYLAPQGGQLIDIAVRARPWSDDLRDDVLGCQSCVEALGLEMLVLNQTRPELGMPVAKVIVPGLRHFWSRYAPGRLYDVPVTMGLTETALTEEQLNPIPMFL